MISIIIPVIRPEKAARCIEAISKEYKFTCSSSVEYSFDFIAEQCHFEIIAEEDKDHVGCPAMVKKLVDKARGDTIMFLGDDTIPQPGFLRSAIIAMDKLPDGWGVVGLNTQDDRPGVGFNDHAHWMASKKMLKHIPEANFSARNINTAMATMS